MERTADPRIYASAINQSVKPVEYTLDESKYTYCLESETYPNQVVDTPIVVVEPIYKANKKSELLQEVKSIQE
jgi:hypothetical protein